MFPRCLLAPDFPARPLIPRAELIQLSNLTPLRTSLHVNTRNSFDPSSTSNINRSMLKRTWIPLLQLQIQRLRVFIQIHSIRTYTMAPLKSWLSIPPDSHFSLANIPFGIITSKHSQVEKRPAVAIGDYVLDLKAFAAENGFSGLPPLKDPLKVFSQPSLNAFAALGQPVHREVRKYLQDVFSDSTSHPQILKDNAALQKAALLPKHETKTHLPMQIGDYTDFFAGINHAFNVGTMFRVNLPCLSSSLKTNSFFPGSSQRPSTKLHPPPSRLPRPRLHRRSIRNAHPSSKRANTPRPHR